MNDLPFRPHDAHLTIRPLGTFKERVTKDQLKDLLLNHPNPVVRGRVRRWKHEHLGVGVYELWVEDPPP